MSTTTIFAVKILSLSLSFSFSFCVGVLVRASLLLVLVPFFFHLCFRKSFCSVPWILNLHNNNVSSLSLISVSEILFSWTHKKKKFHFQTLLYFILASLFFNELDSLGSETFSLWIWGTQLVSGDFWFFLVKLFEIVIIIIN